MTDDNESVKFTYFIAKDPDDLTLYVRTQYRGVTAQIAIENMSTATEELARLLRYVPSIVARGIQEHEVFHNTQDIDKEIDDLLGDS